MANPPQTGRARTPASGTVPKRGEGRSRVRDAAYRLFMADGYEATTMQNVADAAGVAVQTVYYLFGTKAALLADVESLAVLGDRPARSWRDAPWAEALEQETDPLGLIRRFVIADSEIKARLATFVTAVGPALPAAPQDQANRDAGRDEFFRFLVDRLAVLGALNTALSPRRALDIVRVVDSLANYIELTSTRGWTHEDWIDWLTDSLTSLLLRTDHTV